MTQPRMILPGDTVFCTVRTIARFYLLRPDAELNDAILYVLGVYGQKYQVKLLAACAMSTHLHLVIEDPNGQRPAFLRDVHRAIANVTKAMRKWRGAVFGEHPNQTRLLTTGAIIDKIAYTHANPVNAGAVRSSCEWPGVCISYLSCPKPVRVQRPSVYFREDGSMPKDVLVRFELPSELLKEYPISQARQCLKAAVDVHEAGARQSVRSKGWEFAGAKKVMSLSPFKRSTTPEAFGGINPHFAVKGGPAERYREAVSALRLFRSAYREALRQWKEGVRDICFPAGTYLMRVLHQVRCLSEQVVVQT